MQMYRFQFGDVDGATGETLESDHSSDHDALCDAARTVAEMLKEQAQAGHGLSDIRITLTAADGRAVGGIAVTVTHAAAAL
ncbi:MAG: hypothetical protein FJ335_00895 [Sphingomonadales bacterium]|nr:hypothetical protein [Sphingomonadales bacterium]